MVAQRLASYSLVQSHSIAPDRVLVPQSRGLEQIWANCCLTGITTSNLTLRLVVVSGFIDIYPGLLLRTVGRLSAQVVR
jgi:hypothetical protein